MYVYIKLDLQLANGKAKFVLFETIVWTIFQEKNISLTVMAINYLRILDKNVNNLIILQRG